MKKGTSRIFALLLVFLFGSVSMAANETSVDFAQKLKTGRTVQFGDNWAYWKGRSAESVVSEVAVNGFDAIYYLITDERTIPAELIDEFHKNGIAVFGTFFSNSTYSPKDLFPPGWEKWLMEYTTGKNEYKALSFVYPDYTDWMKKRVTATLKKYPFDGIMFQEPRYDGYNWKEVEVTGFCDISEGFQKAFKKATGNKFFPNVTEPDDPHYYKTDTKLYEELIEYRVKTIVDFHDEIINGKGGVRESFPDIVVGTWTCAAIVKNGLKLVREWEGDDPELMVRTVKPDVHMIQTHWPDWLRGDLPADYAKAYLPYIKAARAGDPNVSICIQTDIGSRKPMLRSKQWYVDFLKACDGVGFDSTTYYAFFLRGEVNFDAPELKVVVRKGFGALKLYFDQRIDPDSADCLVGREISNVTSKKLCKVKSVTVDGNIITLGIDKPVSVGDNLSLPIGGISDLPGVRFHKGTVNSIATEKSAKVRVVSNLKDGIK